MECSLSLRGAKPEKRSGIENERGFAASVGEQYTRIWFYQRIRSDKGLTLETSAFRIPVRWSTYIINSVDKTKIIVKYAVKSGTKLRRFGNADFIRGNA